MTTDEAYNAVTPMLQEIDKDGDSLVSFHEFVSVHSRLVAELDGFRHDSNKEAPLLAIRKEFSDQASRSCAIM